MAPVTTSVSLVSVLSVFGRAGWSTRAAVTLQVTLHANFSTQPFAPLVFACRTLQEAAKDAARRVFGRAGCSGIGVQIGSMKLDIAGANDTRVSLGRTELR